MAMDCTFFLYAKDPATGKEFISEDLVSGNNKEWMKNMYNGYPSLQRIHPKESTLPQIIKEKIVDWHGNYFWLTKINLEDYINWYYSYKPYIDAGWCTKKEAWTYRTRGITPFLSNSLEELGAPYEDAEFIEILTADTVLKEKIDAVRNQNLWMDISNSEISIYFWCDN